MDRQTKQRRIETYRRRCREGGLPLTEQRMAVLEAMLDLDDHPTADRVHDVVARRDSRVSRATVYRALESLARIGVITKACHPGKAVRYDSRTETHHHLVCLRCDAIIDVTDDRLDALPVPDTSSYGFVVSDLRVQLRGVCRRCRELEETS
ncbi:MAG: transcriptional repressor [Acidobacteria bacterium]|jgi:Fe2+ or Zn2+ uptake regulation protein|nr:transcriptional repressor [Acidobacteriota bacterium]